ncbi:MAG: Type III pantothenate kinase [Bacteroidia bacterium]|nr:Type III pantothenate kinase [Bacteroidia bacterium]
MNLVIDIGNTRVKYGVFDNYTLVKTGIAEKADISFFRMIFQKFKIKAIIFSSVAHVNKSALAFAEKYCRVHYLNHLTPLPLKNKYRTPQTLGTDRLANAAGAAWLFKGRNCLVIDAGTCIKYDFVSEKGHYMGGAISPGVAMRYQALHHFTKRLPLVKPDISVPLTGNTTDSSINSGVIHGAKAEVKQIIAQYKSQYKRLKTVVTGGDASLFVNIAKSYIFAAPDLTLTGLNHILNYNKSVTDKKVNA